jgi:hypothetical protein
MIRCNILHATGWSGTQLFSTRNSAGINDPEGPEEYNNTEVKYGLSFSFKLSFSAKNRVTNIHVALINTVLSFSILCNVSNALEIYNVISLEKHQRNSYGLFQ